MKLKSFCYLTLISLILSSCQGKAGRLAIDTKKSTQNAFKSVQFKKGKKETGFCLDLPSLVNHLHQMGNDAVRITTQDLFAQTPQSSPSANPTDQTTQPSLNTTTTSPASENNQTEIQWLIQSQPHVHIPYARFFEIGWFQPPQKQNECESLDFDPSAATTTSTQITDDSPNPSSPPHSREETPSAVSEFQTFPATTPLAGNFKIISKSDNLIKYEFTQNDTNNQQAQFQISIEMDSSSSLLISKQITIKGITYFITRKVEWGQMKGLISITKRLAQLWQSKLSQFTPIELVNQIKNLKPNAKPTELIKISLENYSLMNKLILSK